MTIKVGDLARYKPMNSERQIFLGSKETAMRTVRINFNGLEPFALYIRLPDGSAERLVCYVPAGLQTVLFDVEGEFVLAADHPEEIWYWTAEEEPTISEGLSPSFTRIAERKPINREVAMMAALSRQNERRMQAFFARETADLAAIKASLVKEAANAPKADDVAGGKAQPKDKNKGSSGKDGAKAGGKSSGDTPDPANGEGDGGGT